MFNRILESWCLTQYELFLSIQNYLSLSLVDIKILIFQISRPHLCPLFAILWLKFRSIKFSSFPVFHQPTCTESTASTCELSNFTSFRPWSCLPTTERSVNSTFVCGTSLATDSVAAITSVRLFVPIRVHNLRVNFEDKVGKWTVKWFD